MENDISLLLPSILSKTKEDLFFQKGIVVWLTGLSGSGKSTIAKLLEQKLKEENYFSIVLDGDELRKTLNKDLGFSETDRTENIRRAAELAKLLVQKNVITICSFITPMQKQRALAAAITGQAYHEVFVDCPLNICEERDVKGLYKKARNNEITDFTGIGSGFEPAENPWLSLRTGTQSPDESVELLYQQILPYIQPAQ
ncbi:MAG: adenylyl-sulfate kinase [Agriterribacter sp.]